MANISWGFRFGPPHAISFIAFSEFEDFSDSLSFCSAIRSVGKILVAKEDVVFNQQ